MTTPCTDDNLPHVAHIITGLSTGGAEIMLLKLLSAYNRSRLKMSVISLLDRGTLGDKLEALGVPVHVLDMKRRTPWNALAQLKQILREEKPALLQGWMYHGNLAAQLAATMLHPKPTVVWNIRGSHTKLRQEKPLTAGVIWLNARLANQPTAIINNSKTSALYHHADLGMPLDRQIIIPNGFDTHTFAPSSSSRAEIRQELRLSPDKILIGLIGRFDPKKDHPNLLQAAALVIQTYPQAQFLLAGRGIEPQHPVLGDMIERLGLSGHVHLLEERRDIPRLTSALDIAVSSSYSEGFSNTIGEAMACGVPCVVTDAGDSAYLVGETGKVVPPRNSRALAEALMEIIDAGSFERQKLGAMGRARIEQHFSLKAVISSYEQLYEQLLARHSFQYGRHESSR